MVKDIDSRKLRQLYLSFFEQKGHKVIKSASLIPENDPTVLFTTAGMHPLVPYLLGEAHPEGKKLTDVQKCIRTGDIDEVGDAFHCTFFEMLGNWSLGDYFKDDAIAYSWEFLTSEEWLGIPKDKLYFTVFEGDDKIERDTYAADVWQKLGVDASHIFYLSKEHNWWGPAGVTGPCGPDTEMFIDMGKEKCSPDCNPSCHCGKYVEIWNDVFMEYNKNADGSYTRLNQRNVDTGMGLERTLAILKGYSSVYETDLFSNIIKKIEEITGKEYNEETKNSFRIVSDHTKAATLILGDERGIVPSNVEQGYVLRRLIRRVIRHLKKLGVEEPVITSIAEVVIRDYGDIYPELVKNHDFIIEELTKEETAFNKTIHQGLREFNKLVRRLDNNKTIDASDAFRLYDTFGFPIEFTIELAEDQGLTVDIEGFDQKFAEHQEKSRMGADKHFKGGLADNSEQTTKLHTATHLLHASLRKLLGDQVKQKGSNITPERLRFDFSFDRKLTPEEVTTVERMVNEVIEAGLAIDMKEMTLEEAKTAGAIGLFENKYDKTKVKVYKMGDYSMEVCGGPHATNTKELGKFKILKEESSSAGVRRIKAISE